MRLRLLVLALVSLVARGASAQLVAAPDASPLGKWRGTSTCVGQRAACRNEIVVYRFARIGRGDSLSLDARKVVDGREEEMGVLTCGLNAARAFITCAIPLGKWRFTVRHDSLVGQLRLRDGTWVRDVRAGRAREGGP